jgi:hypothetical protein
MFVDLLSTKTRREGVETDKKLIFFSLVILILSKNVCFSHRLQYNQFEGGIGIEAIYDDGTPISYSEVKIFSPTDGETEFQQGLTDKNGRFVFYPDIKGKWKIVVDDGMGHRTGRKVSREFSFTIRKGHSRYFHHLWHFRDLPLVER